MERRILMRLCHNCNTLNESEEEILRCSKCNKGFLALNYFEKLKARAQMAASGQVPSQRQELPAPVSSPIAGLIVLW